MATVKRSNRKAFEVLAARLDQLDKVTTKAGWFATSRYEDGTPIAYIAITQEFGVTIHHPGGTPYKILADGRAQFVSKNSPEAAGLPLTEAHDIVIPPRPFMRPTILRCQDGWLKIAKDGQRKVLNGKLTAEQVMDALGLNIQAEIARSITLVTTPPIKPATIAARLRARADKKTRGLLTKPLEDTLEMINHVQHVTEASDAGSGQ